MTSWLFQSFSTFSQAKYFWHSTYRYRLYFDPFNVWRKFPLVTYYLLYPVLHCSFDWICGTLSIRVKYLIVLLLIFVTSLVYIFNSSRWWIYSFDVLSTEFEAFYNIFPFRNVLCQSFWWSSFQMRTDYSGKDNWSTMKRMILKSQCIHRPNKTYDDGSNCLGTD